MLRKLLRSELQASLSSQKQARVAKLKEYICLREALNKEATDISTRDYQNLREKTGLDNQTFGQLFTALGLNPGGLHKYFTPEQAALEWEREMQIFKQTPFFDHKRSPQEVINGLRIKYPEVASYNLNHSERAKAVNDIADIFIDAGPRYFVPGDDKVIIRFLREFENKIKVHIRELQEKHKSSSTTSPHDGSHPDPVQRISQVLNELYQDLDTNPAAVYGRIRQFVDIQRGNTQVSGTKALPTQSKNEIDSDLGVVPSDPLAAGDDTALLLDEANDSVRENTKYNFLGWTGDVQTIFEAAADRPSTWTIKALTLLTGGLLLYKLYQADASYFTLGGLLVANIYRTKSLQMRNKLNYIVKMDLKRDGRTVDLFVQNAQNKVNKVENVPLSQFKVHRDDYKFTLKKEFTKDPVDPNHVKLSQIRRHGIARDSWVATWGTEHAQLPFNYKGNNLILENIFNGRELAH